MELDLLFPLINRKTDLHNSPSSQPLPLVIFVIIIITIGLVRLISYIRESKRLPQVIEVYDVATGNVERGRKAVNEIDATEEGLQEIYARFTSQKKRDVKEIELFREEFDKANKLVKAKDKEAED